MDDARLATACAEAEVIERDIRRHLSLTTGAFEQARGIAAYRGVVALRKALEHWIVLRAQRPQS